MQLHQESPVQIPAKSTHLIGDDSQLREAVNVRTEDVVFPDSEALLRRRTRGHGFEEVVDLLVVDLHVADLHLGLPRRAGLVGDLLEQGVAQARDQALVVLSAHHGVAFAGT